MPFGGTSGLVESLLPPDVVLAAVEPPLMNWSGNLTLSSATALTTPQEFFLGSQYTAIITTVPAICHHRNGGDRSPIQISGSDINRPVIYLLPGACGGVFR